MSVNSDLSLTTSARLQEFEVIAQIKLLQLASNNYSFTPDGHFREWFAGVEKLSEAERSAAANRAWRKRRSFRQELLPCLNSLSLSLTSRCCSYGLSCEIEPLSESASNTLRAKKNGGIMKRWSE